MKALMTIQEAREFFRSERETMLSSGVLKDATITLAFQIAIEAIDYVIRTNYQQND